MIFPSRFKSSKKWFEKTPAWCTKAELDDKNSLVPLSFFSQTFACPENVKIKLLTLGGAIIHYFQNRILFPPEKSMSEVCYK